MDGAFSSAYKSSLERKGMKLGIKLGREQGIKQGIEEEKRETARTMLQMNTFSLQEIATITRLPIEKIQEIQRSMK